jgi:hypothetical protein
LKVGAARVPSPDVRFGPPALRSLRGNSASPSWLRWFPRPSQGPGQPRPATRVEVPGKGLGRQTRGRRLAACGTRATLTPAQARSEAQPRAAFPPIHRHAARRSLAQRSRPFTGTQRGAASRSVPAHSQARSEAQPRAAFPPIHRHAARRSLAQRSPPLTGTQRGAASRSVPAHSQARSEAQPRAAFPPTHRHAARRSLAQRAIRVAPPRRQSAQTGPPPRSGRTQSAARKAAGRAEARPGFAGQGWPRNR